MNLVIFAEKPVAALHYGQLSHSCIKTCCNSVH